MVSELGKIQILNILVNLKTVFLMDKVLSFLMMEKVILVNLVMMHLMVMAHIFF